MADKRITELTELLSLSQDDLFVVVDNPAGTAITKRITAANVFRTISFATSALLTTGIALRSNLVANAVATTNAITSAAEFVTTASAQSTNTAYQYAVLATNKLDAPTANVTRELATAKFVLDVSNAGALITNSFGVIIRTANTGTRAARPNAFIALAEDTASTTLSTQYLLNVGQGGISNVSANLTAASGNVSNMFSNTTASATHKLKIQVNGSDYYLLCARAGASGL